MFLEMPDMKRNKFVASPALMAHKACICKKSCSLESIFFYHKIWQPAAIVFFFSVSLHPVSLIGCYSYCLPRQACHYVSFGIF